MTTGLPSGKSEADNDWVLDFSNFRSAWTRTPPSGGQQKGAGVIVVHPDTGYTRHPELLAGGHYFTDDGVAKNFLDPRWVARDRLYGSGVFWFPSHGTSTASVLMSEAGHPNSSSPSNPPFPNYTVTDEVSGVAPEAWVIPNLVTRSVVLTDGSDAALALAIYNAIDMNRMVDNVGVISISLGRPWGPTTEGSLHDALKAAKAAGIVVCAAAGQFHRRVTREPIYPGSDPNTICCAACNASHVMLNSGFYGAAVNITAPGVNVWMARSERLNRTPIEAYSVHGDGTGSSYATAITAGACALWQAFHGRDNLIATYGKPLIFDLFKEMLRRSCDTRVNTWDTTRYGMGVLDADKLLSEPLPTKSDLEDIIDED